MIVRSARKPALIASISGSDCPFLYQTRTILHHPKPCRSHTHRPISTSSSNCQRTSQRHSSRNQAQGDEPESKQPNFLKQKATQVASSKPKPVSSITPAEQAAFDNIWALFEKPAPSTAKARATSTDHTDTDYKNILELFSSPPSTEQAHYQASELPADEPVEQEQDVQRAPQFASKDVSKTRSASAAQRPSGGQPKLDRASAMREIKGFLRETATSSTSASRSTDKTQSTALNIVEDVADNLTVALASENPRPDIAMWRVAEEKIFPLIQLLRPSTTNLSTPVPTEQEPVPAQTESPTTGQLHPLIPSDIPLLPLLSQTYPSLTLLILRLYTTHQPTSPYALALLPTLKSLGPTSYVLGAHTHFYNTLLSLYWRMYSDLRGMNSLLGEMDANGVEFDGGTWEVLKAVGEDRDRDVRDHDASGMAELRRGRVWWDRLEQRMWWPRIGVEWRDVVRRRLEEKGVLVGEVMREDHAVLREGVGETEERPEYVVTL